MITYKKLYYEVSDMIKRPSFITFDITYNCNLRCLHCYNYSGECNKGRNEMSDQEFLNVCKQIIELSPQNVCLCGGEPLLKYDLLCKIAKRLSGGNILVSMVTNGLLMTEDIAIGLKKSGIKFVQISLDGVNSTTHDWLRNKKGVYDAAITAMKHLKKQNLSFAISCCPSKKNINEIESLIDLVHHLGAKEFRMQPLMVIGRAKQIKEFELSYIEYKKIIDIFTKCKKDPKYKDIDLEWGDPTEHLSMDYINKMDVCSSFGIDPYGNIYLSPYLPIRYGNLLRHSLMQYWNSGLIGAWKLQINRDLSNLVISTEDLDINQTNSYLPETYLEEPIHFDLMDPNNNSNMSFKEFVEN